MLVGAASLVLVATRVLAVSYFDQTSAAAVLGAQGTGSVVVGALITLWPLVPLAVGVLILLPRAMMPGKSGEFTRFEWFLLFLCVVFLVPWIVGVVLGFVLGLNRLVLRIRHKEIITAATPAARATLRKVAVGSLLTGVLALAAVSDPWLPAERFDLKTGVPVVGYALRTESGQITVLRDRDRRVIRLSVGDVSDRSYCEVVRSRINVSRHLPDWMLSRGPTAALIAARGEHPNYPPCPDLYAGMMHL